MVVAVSFDEIVKQVGDVYDHSVLLTSYAQEFKIFHEESMETIKNKLKLRDVENQKLTHILTANLIYIEARIEEIEEIVRHAHANAIFSAKKIIKPREFDINSLKFLEKFQESKTTNWTQLKEHLDEIGTLSEQVSQQMREIFSQFFEEFFAIKTPSKMNIDKIDEHLQALASYLKNIETSEEPTILIQELVTGLSEITHALSKSTPERGNYSAAVHDHENRIQEELHKYIVERKRIHSEIFSMQSSH